MIMVQNNAKVIHLFPQQQTIQDFNIVTADVSDLDTPSSCPAIGSTLMSRENMMVSFDCELTKPRITWEDTIIDGFSTLGWSVGRYWGLALS